MENFKICCLLMYLVLCIASKDDVNKNFYILEDYSNMVESQRYRRDILANDNETQSHYETDNHRYYTSKYFIDGSNYFIDLRKPHHGIDIVNHEKSSESYRKAYTVDLPFDFMFYGNIVNSIVITTGGFVNIGPKFHQFVHLVHYVAPLMADFNPSISNSSRIYLGEGKDFFIVQWTDVLLNGSKYQNDSFTFQTILHKNGTIILAYDKIPIPPVNIPNITHDVTVGFSDGFIMSYQRKSLFTGRIVTHNYIYTYSKVSFPLNRIQSGSAYKLDLLPNCVQLTSCNDCLNASSYIPFKCKWCPVINRCSDTLDWNRAEWLSKKCNIKSFMEVEKCSIALTKKKVENGKNLGAIIGGAVGVVLFILIVVGLLWFHYSYTHPQSKSGMWLIANHPRRLMKAKFSPAFKEDIDGIHLFDVNL